MAKYSGKSVVVARPICELYDKLSNLSSFQQRIDELPEEAKAKLGEVRFTENKIIINAPGVGEITFAIAECVAPTLIRLTAENSPVPFNILMNFKEVSTEETEVRTDLDVDIPAMLRPLVGGKMQEAADKFSEMFANLFGAHNA